MLRQSYPSIRNKVYVFGAKGCGKTCVIHQSVYGKRPKSVTSKNYEDTVEDIYSAVIECKSENKCVKEKVYLFDTAGLWLNFNLENLKHYVSYADGIIIVYAIDDRESFQVAEQIKKAIDRLKEKKEIPIVCLANKLDACKERKVRIEEAQYWAQKERIKYFEVSAIDRKSLIEPLIHLTSAMNPPQNKSTLSQLGRKVKGNSSITVEL